MTTSTMTATTTKRQLKRLSLLQTASSPTTSAISLSGAPIDSAVEHSSYSQSSGSSSGPPSSHIVNSPAGTGFVSNPRRQSTINYLPREEQPGTTFPSPLTNKYQESRSSSSSPRITSQESEENSPTASAAGRERAALTLVEKHADLLRFIAQKESKCLELRSQLALHEAELLELKRKWERIVGKGFAGGGSAGVGGANINRSSSAVDASDASPQAGAMLNGIRESMQGVGRFIAGLGADPTTAYWPEVVAGSKGAEEKGVGDDDLLQTTSALQRRVSKDTSADHESNSSVSTTYTDASSRMSRSSMSSVDDVPPCDSPDLSQSVDNDVERSQSILLEDIVSPAHPIKRTNSLIRQRKEKNTSRASISSLPTSAPITKHTRSNTSFSGEQPPSQSQSQPRTTRPNHKRTATMSGAALPLPASIPGLSTLATSHINTNPLSLPTLSSLVDTVGKSVGKKFEQMQGGRVHKRASTLLSEASSSLFAAFVPPSPSPGTVTAPPASPQTSTIIPGRKPGGRARKMIPTPPTSAKSTTTQSSTGSLIDDIEEEELGFESSNNGAMAALIPDVVPKSPASPVANADDKPSNNEEWNW